MSKPTDTITIRVPNKLKTELEEICKKEKINLNLLINQILEKSVNWDTHLSKMGWVTFQPSTVREIMSYLTKKEMESIASKISSDVLSSINFLYGDTKLENLIKFIESWLQSANSPYRYSETKTSHEFIVDHSMGKNWSEFAIIVLKDFVGKVGHRIRDTEIKENQYSYKIEKS